MSTIRPSPGVGVSFRLSRGSYCIALLGRVGVFCHLDAGNAGESPLTAGEDERAGWTLSVRQDTGPRRVIARGMIQISQ
jgi:hypothetical protein